GASPRAEPAVPSFSAPRAPAATLVLVHLLGWGAACGWLLLDAARGGHAWKQGDWLINAEAVAVRRGLFGSGLLRLSDLTGIGPLAMTVALQLLLLTAAAGLTLAAALRLRVGFRLFLLLVSPGF